MLWLAIVALSGCLRAGYDAPLDGVAAPDDAAHSETFLDASVDGTFDGCTPDCYGEACGADDGCGGSCQQACPVDLVHRWSKGFGSAAEDIGYGVVADGNGHITITGKVEGAVDFGGGVVASSGESDIFLVSYDLTGEHRWAKALGSSIYDIGFGVTADQENHVFVTGRFQGPVDFGGGALETAGHDDIFVASYDSSGVHRWSRGFGGPQIEHGRAVATDGSGHVTIAGFHAGDVDFDGELLTSEGSSDVFVASFGASGASGGASSFGAVGQDTGYGVAVDESGNVFIAGSFEESVDFGGGLLTSAGNYDAFVASFSASGDHRWSKRFGASNHDISFGVSVDADGNAILVGTFQYSIDFGGGSLDSAGGWDIFVASFGPSGAHRWSRTFGGTTDDHGRGVTVDRSGNAYITGDFRGTADFGDGPLPSAGGYDTFVASYAPGGEHRYSKAFGGTSSEVGHAVTVDGSGNLTVVGDFQGTTDFGGGPLVSAGGSDVFVLHLGP